MDGDPLVKRLLNGRQEITFIDTDQGNRHAFGSRPAGAADAVDIVLGHLGNVEVHDAGQLDDVQPPGSNVSGYQDVHLTLLEIAQRPGARWLALVAVDGLGIHTRLDQMLGETVRPPVLCG
ncbi:hypothetical protein ES703_88143 [subsurface metagenome]